ncbi:hypothetical protein [Marinoscillum furvescens]|uniref:Secreted protein (Por secretion system target) n=1 Tax=Marinoscillum furvescens DSM 4134 TaxID=1122208 RepID=A0A3D9LI21_MARFU|nr:hypothetical protein [Marinoscillum furvescens]REE05515.1 hypothetical protein C7460_10130 [Marinoscillum furvescens DSM 4134]
MKCKHLLRWSWLHAGLLFSACMLVSSSISAQDFATNANGAVIFEAESFTANNAGVGAYVGYTWEQATALAGYSGTGYMIASGATNQSTQDNDKPNMTYSVNFGEAGSYDIWAYVYFPDGSSDSYFYGLGTASGTQLRGGTLGQWQWRKGDGSLTAAGGIENLVIELREINAAVDRVVLTNAGFDPANLGSDALTNISLSVGTLTFDAATTTYNVTLPAGTTSVDVVVTTADVLATYTGGGSIDVSGGSGSTSIQVTDYEGNASSTTYTVNLTVEAEVQDADGDGVPDHEDRCPGSNDNADTNSNNIPDCLEHEQANDATGLVNFQAESYYNINQNGASATWEEASIQEGHRNAYISTPASSGYGDPTTAPFVQYAVNFVKTGEHHLWVRVYFPNASSDSFHFGLDGETAITYNQYPFPGGYAKWVWYNFGSFSVSAAGMKTFNIYTRDPNGLLDQIILTTDATYDPTAWSGSTSNEWATASNWSDGYVPGEFDAVTIPANADVVASGDVSINEVTIASGASLALLGSATGNATIKRNTTGSAGYSIVGAPVSGADLSALAADYLYDYDEATSQWVAMSSGAMASGKGYFLGYDAVGPEVSLSGALVSGNVSTSITNSGDGFNIVANPYAAAISADDFIAESTNATNTTGSIYLWNDGGANTGGERSGNYVVANDLNTGVNVGSLQGFFVEASAAGDVLFTPAMQTSTAGANSDANYYRKASDIRQLLKLSVSGNELRNETAIGFVTDATFGRDYALDATFLQGNEYMAFYSLMADTKMATQGLPAINEAIEVDLGVDLKVGGEYTLAVEQFQGFDDIAVTLLDKVTGVTHELGAQSSITFTVDGDYSANRFTLVAAPTKILSVDKLNSKLKVFGERSSLTINYTSDQTERVSIYALDGRSVFDKQVSFTGNQAVIAPKLNTRQVYILRVNNESIKFVLQ